MPELPEVETVRRGLEPAMLGRLIQDVILRRPDLRGAFPENFRKEISGRKVMKLERRGKYILAVLENGEGFGLHLGMSGRIKIQDSSTDQNFGLHDHVVFMMEDGTKIIFNDPRRFGQLFKIGPHWESEKPFANMGPEPLGKKFLKNGFGVKLKNKKAPIKTVLLDQNIVAGVGNIYACEALFDAGISPLKKAGAVNNAQTEKLAHAVQHVLEKAIEAGGSTLRDHRKTNGEMGYFQHHFSVYDREGKACPGCTCDTAQTGGIRRITQAGRSTFYCPRKQK
ncbi:MAG: bifunctional DNA-formamidopyrimidine glycosylase/DNA-(apurinic or apyrimidinic site) lyase [Alphaproteobacteria bacterium PRO2]|nr:bifunctional DNA-formamidopyrimidine glycosylase/DNA-(apurinic or apyrimidinic site) lyase [Alphaproteobacteria bacterium PRO2]